MASASSVLGPPIARCSNAASVNRIYSVVSNFNSATTISYHSAICGLTENNSDTYLSSGNPCLELFFHVVPDTPPESVVQRIKQQAWAHDALTTLKLICNLLGVRGTGKSDKEGFYTAALWLHGLHPKTLAWATIVSHDLNFY